VLSRIGSVFRTYIDFNADPNQDACAIINFYISYLKTDKRITEKLQFVESL
jgi:hypothetical protein